MTPSDRKNLELTVEIAFRLLNPAMSLILAATFFVLWQRRRAYRYPLLLALAFLLSGIAFTANDFLQPINGPAARILVNALFTAAILLACVGALVRAGARAPATLFAAICAGGATAFFWYLFIEPSTVARIYILNAAYAAMALVTATALIRGRPNSTVDWLFVGLALFLFVLVVLRSIAIFMGVLDINSSGSLADSVYWASVQAMTPLLALMLALSFLAAFAVQVVSELRDEADRDYLTSLLNRRGFDARAASALDENSKPGSEAALMIADIDNFKTVNDTFGHAAGDQVIAAIGRVLADHSSALIIGRTGGEEFALLYEDATHRELLAHAAVIRAEFSRATVPSLPHGYPLSVSIGIHPRQPGESLGAMMRRADEALYLAKTNGRDQAFITRPVDRRRVSAPIGAGSHD